MKQYTSLADSFKYAISGILHSVKNNRNLRIHFLIAGLVITASIFLKVSKTDNEILVIMIFFVICAEMINSSIEEIVNLIAKDYRQEAKIAKDVSAGMVLISVIIASAIGVFIFTPYVLEILK